MYIKKKWGKKKTRAQRRKTLLCLQICLPAVCCVFLDQHVHHEPQFVLKPSFLRSKCRMTNFPNVFIKHETHIFFSAYKDAIKMLLK